jgi:hypothetical protein
MGGWRRDGGNASVIRPQFPVIVFSECKLPRRIPSKVMPHPHYGRIAPSPPASRGCSLNAR